ncbi:MAG: MazG-like family protein [Clostridia bacterium]|nr:MazG-like family protein [Clostridia bacterium]
MDVARNARTVEWLKAELVAAAAEACKALVRGDEEALLGSLSDSVLIAYVLARRVGIPCSRLDDRLEQRLEANIAAGHELEQWFGDLSAVAAHLARRRGDLA